MIKIENVVLPSSEQWKALILGCRNPLNSWSRYDSKSVDGKIEIGENDLSLMNRLAKAGTDHRKFMRMITVYVDITAPLYWWKEFDTYKVGTVANSCSTMHKIADKRFTMDDFSCEHLINEPLKESDSGSVLQYNLPAKCTFQVIVCMLNTSREMFLRTKDKKYWWQMIQLLPTSYNQKRTVMLNYEVLTNMYRSRHNHKLDEWREFCEWVKSLPYSHLIIGDTNVTECELGGVK